MGRPKGTLRLGGRTFLDRVTGALRDGGCERVLVVVTEREAEVEAEARRLPVDVLVNPDPGDGPITSMRLALSALDDAVEALAWLPLDFPLVTPEDVRRLLREAAGSDAPLTLPVHGGKRGHPPVFRRSLFSELLDPALEGGARTVVHRHLDRALQVEFTEPGVVVDVDTPEALVRVRQRHASEAGEG
jgi:CTP:molybdopterin cytidylyltransferase MocA